MLTKIHIMTIRLKLNAAVKWKENKDSDMFEITFRKYFNKTSGYVIDYDDNTHIMIDPRNGNVLGVSFINTNEYILNTYMENGYEKCATCKLKKECFMINWSRRIIILNKKVLEIKRANRLENIHKEIDSFHGKNINSLIGACV